MTREQLMDTEAAIEAGARAWFDRNQAHRRDAGAKDMDGKTWTWDALTESDRAGYLALSKAIVVPALKALGGAV